MKALLHTEAPAKYRSDSVRDGAEKAITGVLFYDANCAFCRAAADRWQGFLKRRGLATLPLQGAEAQNALGLREGELPDEIKLACERGVFGGADALLEIARRTWWSRPLAVLGSLPPLRRFLRRGYGAFAKRRHCMGGVCKIEIAKHAQRSQWPGWLPLILFSLATCLLRGPMPEWVFMWTLAFAIFAGCKWLTWWRTSEHVHAPRWRVAAYLLAWVGMDAKAFLSGSLRPEKPGLSEWLAAAVKTSLGVILVWYVARLIPAEQLRLQAWCGLVGVVFLLHFGAFHLLSLFWRTVGVEARPIMRSPMLARSLAEFWNARWNLAFHQLAERMVFRPILRRTNMTCALLATFGLSGLVHDLVISLPARGGYGLPTCYFLLQAAGVWLERTLLGRQLGLGRGWRGRAFAWIMTLAPLPWLAHEAFLARVILPFLQALHGL